MKVTLLAPAVALLLLACSCHGDAKPTAEEQEYIDYCMKKFGPDTTISPAPGGGYNCVNCAGSAYDDPKTGDRKCCNRLHEKFTVDPTVKTEGGCCRPPQTFSYDPTSKTGGCCPPGQHWEAGSCKKREHPPPDDNKCPPCPKGYACACDGDLGIKYGHCYTLTDVNGNHLSREIGGVYQSGGEIDGLIFKVCKSTDDCDEDMGKYVPEDGNWVMQDQQGSRGVKGPGWFGNQSPHMGIAPFNLPNMAAKFTAEGLCMFGDCTLCLRLTNSGLSSPCPMGTIPDKTHIGPAANPNNCKPFRFQEATCMKDVPPKYVKP